MKLASILAQGGVPSGSAARFAPVPPSLGIGEALQGVAESTDRVAQLLGKAEDEKRKYQQALEASRAVSGALDQLDQAEQTLKMGQRDPASGEVITAPTSSTDYMPAWLKLRDKISEDAIARAESPDMKLVIGKLLEAPFRERQHAARTYANQLFVGQYTAGIEDELQSLARRAITDPQAGADGTSLWETRAMAVLASAQGALSAEKIRQLRERFTEHVDIAAARRLGEADPEAAMEALRAGKYRLAPDRADAEATAIGARWDRRVKQAEADQRRFETSMEAWWKEQQQLTVSDAVLKANRGEFTLEQLEETARDWRLHRGDIEAIRAAIERPDKPAKAVKEVSDPVTLDRVIADTHSIKPKMTERDLLNFRTQGLLSVADWKSALDRLRETSESLKREARSEADRLDARERSVNQTKHAQAEQELRAALGIPTLFDKIDPAKEKAWAAALPELRRRSLAYGGKEDPLVAGEEIATRFKRILGQDALLTEEQLKKLLLFPTPAALEAAKPTIPASTYKQQQEYFRQLKEAVDTRRKMLEDQAATTGAKPGGSMGRK